MGSRLRASGTVAGAERWVLGLAAALILLGAVAADDGVTAVDGRALDRFAVLFLAAGAGLVLAGRRFPVQAAVAALVLTYAWYAVGYRSAVVNVVTMAAFYRLGASDKNRAKVVVTGGSVATTGLMMLVIGEESLADTAAAAGYVVVAVLFGELLRNRRLLVDHFAERARRAEAEAERRVVEERLRIARDLHDVLAHTVSVMTVQSGVAADAVDRDPDGARRALTVIRNAGRSAMREVQATVAVLRDAGPGREPAHPAPQLDRLPELVDAVRAQGLDVRLDVSVAGEPLPEVVELTAFRVAQEGLTNVVRHAGATTAWVTVDRQDSCVVVEVRDDGREAAPPGPPGMGLRGMSERVEALGGSLHHGRDRSSGWTVRARLPVVTGR